MPVTKEDATELVFKVTITVEPDGAAKKAVTSKVKVVLRTTRTMCACPAGCRSRPGWSGSSRRRSVAAGETGESRSGEAVPRTGGELISGGSTDTDPVLGSRWPAKRLRVEVPHPLPLLHFSDRLQMSGYLRQMEEASDRFSTPGTLHQSCWRSRTGSRP